MYTNNTQPTPTTIPIPQALTAFILPLHILWPLTPVLRGSAMYSLAQSP